MCPYTSAECQDCGNIRQLSDPLNPGYCLNCESSNATRIPCDGTRGFGPCPAMELDAAYERSVEGNQLMHVAWLETQIRMQISLNPEDIRADAFEIMQVLRLERDRLEQELKLRRG